MTLLDARLGVFHTQGYVSARRRRLPGMKRGLDELVRASQAPNLSTARALALAASSSRFLGGAVVSSERRRRVEIAATSSTAASKASSLAFDGLLKPLIFLTNCSDAARTSSSLTGGSKLKRVLIFLHIEYAPAESVSWRDRQDAVFEIGYVGILKQLGKSRRWLTIAACQLSVTVFHRN